MLLRVIIGTFIAAVLGLFSWYTQPSFAQTTQPSPTATATTLSGNTATKIISANPGRRSVRICNTGGTNAVWIWPGTSLTATSDYVIPAVSSHVISCYTPPTSPLNSSAQYNASSEGGGGSTVSVEEWLP